jgi:hypothetical protein
MSKRRAQQGPGHEVESARQSEAGRQAESTVDVDASMLEQAILGNAALASRLGETEGGQAASGGLIEQARPLVVHAMAALQLDPADPERLARRVALLQASVLEERQRLIDKLTANEALQQAVDAALDAHAGGHDVETRWAVDATLTAVAHTLDGGSLDDGVLHHSDGPILLGADVDVGGLIDAVAQERAPASSAAISALCSALSLVARLEEDEEDEAWLDPAVGLD